MKKEPGDTIKSLYFCEEKKTRTQRMSNTIHITYARLPMKIGKSRRHISEIMTIAERNARNSFI